MSSEVAVCETPPVFVQQTVVPVGMSTVAGLKKLSPIATMMSLSRQLPEARCGAEPAKAPACGISSAPKLTATIAATSELRRKWAPLLPIPRPV
jgi:hypothetical protein